MKKSKTYNLQTRIRSALRKLWLWSPMRRNALAKARIGRGLYECSDCKNIFSRQDIAVDHTIPVTPISGFDTWDEFIQRLFCSPEGLKVLCSLCHSLKTKEENVRRRSFGTGTK
jgi:5-methylcytosine-specific restriction endonuclease McrA